MRDTMLRQQRDYALFCAYQDALKEKSFSTQKEAINYVLASPAPQWFVSREFCAAVISSRIRGKDHYRMSKTKRRKFDALYELYKEKRKDPAYSSCNHQDLCEIIVQTPAPEWFLNFGAAEQILLRQRRIRKEKMADRYVRE